ncbi:FGGY-family carbohydrate kinase [uncultured Roseibium sp.]|uniref:FGGY-family carbohydrate kinase n=1 Tax=uncultured Roseibium sp. TaxID=1936171 RepID=UPI0026389640|nr:FGGY-family carbohydrate kinase [uncultured Roseibium sp.]
MSLFLAVDVGTGSVRAGVFSQDGQLLAQASQEIRTWHPRPHFAQQSSADIWGAVCASVQSAMSQASVAPEDVAGLGFDATCSLVVADGQGEPLSISPDGEREQDIVLWADHRAIAEASRIDETGHQRLSISGGKISPEMQLPKLLWIKENLPSIWEAAGHFFDLPDWLTWRATGNLTRSLCSTVCKWTYQGEAGTTGEGWDAEFFALAGLKDLADEGFGRIGTECLSPAAPLGQLSEKAAQELGLTSSTLVAASMIDAHAGAMGTLGVTAEAVGPDRMALIAGTSACHITVAQQAAFVPGVWGPYYGAVLPDLWANEAGQSMAGAAIDTVLQRHSAFEDAKAMATGQGKNVYDFLDDFLSGLSANEPPSFLSVDRHIIPDFNGNRAPLADPRRLGVTWGQTAVSDIEDLARDYLACIQSLAYGTRHILDQLAENGVRPDAIVVSGGLGRNSLYCKTHADVTGLPVLLPDQEEPVLLGTAMLAAVGSGKFESLRNAMDAMSGPAKVLQPDTRTRAFHDRKYRVFRAMHDDFETYRKIMSD